MNKNALYVYYFWKYRKAEHLEDMLTLPIESISDYIIEMGKFYYEESGVKDDYTIFDLAFKNSICNK